MTKTVLVPLGADEGAWPKALLKAFPTIEQCYDPQAGDADPEAVAAEMIELLQNDEYMEDSGYGWLTDAGGLCLTAAGFDKLWDDASERAREQRDRDAWMERDYEYETQAGRWSWS